jgi:two-component system sensor histidine kinase YesM
VKLKYKVTIAFALFIVGPFLVVGWLSAYKASESLKEEWGRTTLQLAMQNHVTIEKTMSSINDKTITFLDTHFFNQEGLNFWSSIETLSGIRSADTILERWSSDGTVYSLYMMNIGKKQPPIDLSNKEEGFIYVNINRSELPEWTDHARNARGAGTFRLIGLDNGMTDVRFMRSILNTQWYDETYGFLVVSNLKVLLKRDLVSVRLPDNAGIFLFNELGELLMNTGTMKLQMESMPDRLKKESEGYFFANYEGENWLFAFSRLSAFDTLLVYQIPMASITGNQTAFQWLMMIVSAIYLMLVLLFVLYLLRMIVKPLIKLVSITKIYEPGKKLDIGDEHPRSDEFGILYGAFLKMTRRLDQSFEENYMMKIRQKENELATLHSQITPHLLYNTLDSIYWYALDSGNTDVGEMVKDLSKLLRIGLSKGKTMITMGEEVEHVQAYGRLQMKRYPDTFEVIWDIDESVKTYVTPKVIVQPLVENAIFHGVSGMDGEGTIWIRIKKAEDEVHIIVEDNGFVPIDMERLNGILSGEATDKGYGIRNVHQRIQLHFDEKYGLRFEERAGGGLIAIIHFPLSTGE